MKPTLRINKITPLINKWLIFLMEKDILFTTQPRPTFPTKFLRPILQIPAPFIAIIFIGQSTHFFLMFLRGKIRCLMIRQQLKVISLGSELSVR